MELFKLCVERSTITLPPVRSHSQLLMWVVQKPSFLVNCVHKQYSQCSCSCIETLVILQAKFHVVSSLLSVLKMLAYECPCTPLKISLPENETTVNLAKCLFHRNYAFIWRFDSYSITNKALVAFWREFHFNILGSLYIKMLTDPKIGVLHKCWPELSVKYSPVSPLAAVVLVSLLIKTSI